MAVEGAIEQTVSGQSKDSAFWKRSAVLAGSAGLGIVVSEALVDKFISDDVDDEETDMDEAEMWRGALMVGMGLVGGRVLYRWSRDAAVGVAVGVAGMGAYRIADGLGWVTTARGWFGLEEGEGEEELPATTSTTTTTSTPPAHGATRRHGHRGGERIIVGEILPRVGAR